jgi:small subunit ribosomal protein S8e
MRKSVENLSKRKFTGGKKTASRRRRKYETDRYPNEPVVGKAALIQRRVRGGNRKIAFKTVEFANVSDPSEKRTIRSKILKVSKNAANKDYERRGVLTKGAIIDTDLGQAKVISRPAQHGVINAILLNR